MALVGASVIAVTPVAPAQTPNRVVDTAVSLSASTTAYCPPGDTTGACSAADVGQMATPFAAAAAEPSLLNVPLNLFNAIANIPASQIAGLNLFAQSLEDTGSLLVWSPTNVFGFDSADPAKLQSIIDLLIPFPALSTEIGRQSVIWAQANFPVNPGCAAAPGACPDPAAILGELLQVPTFQLYEGYTFPNRVNPFDGSDVGYPDGYVKLDPNKPAQDFLDSLLAPPTGVQTVTLDQVGATFARVGAALFNSFYPFVQNSEYYNPEQTGLAYVFRALSPFLCADCNRDPANGYAGVYDNPFLYDNYNPQFPPAEAPTTLAAASVPEGDVADDESSSPAASSLTTEAPAPTQKLAVGTPPIESTDFASADVEALDTPAESLPEAKPADSATLGQDDDESTVAAPDTAADTSAATDASTGSAAETNGGGAEKTRGKHWKPGTHTSVPEKIKSSLSKLGEGLTSTAKTSDAKPGDDAGSNETAGKHTAKDKKPDAGDSATG